MSLTQIFLYSLIPAMVLVVSSFSALWKVPGKQTQSAIQHFTAGVVLAAAVFELIPDLNVKNNMLGVTIGFSAGIALMLFLRKMFDNGEEEATPKAFIAAIGIDIFIDGALLGLAYSVAGAQGAAFLIAVTLEATFIGLGSVVTLIGKGVSKAKAIIIQVGIGALIPIAAILGSLAVASVDEQFKIGFLAFGVSALLYLVTEELLVEAHESEDTPLATAMFFVGFLIILLVDASGIL